MATYIFGSYHFSFSDPDYRLWIGDQEVKVELQQLQILAFFIEHRDELITKKMLKGPIWGVHAEDGTVASAVSRLKKMLKERGDGLEYIQVEPKRGYRFICPVTVEASETDRVDAEKPLATVQASHSETQNKELETDIGASIDALPDDQKAPIYLHLAERASQNKIGSYQAHWRKLVESNYGKFLQILDYYGNASTRKELEMVIHMAPFWDMSGRWIEGRERLQLALARQEENTRNLELKAQALVHCGAMSFQLDDHRSAKQSLTEGLRLGREIGDNLTMALALRYLGEVAEAEGRYPDAKTILEAGLEAAQREFEVTQEENAKWLIGRIYSGLGAVERSQGNYSGAKDHFMNSLAIMEQTGDRRRTAFAYSRLSVVAVSQKDLARARFLLDKSRDTTYGPPGKQSIALHHFNLGIIEVESGNPRAALEQLKHCLELRQAIGERRGVARAREAIGKICALIGDDKEAARMIGGASGLRTLAKVPMSPTEQKRYSELSEELHKKYPKEFEEAEKKVLEEIIVV